MLLLLFSLVILASIAMYLYNFAVVPIFIRRSLMKNLTSKNANLAAPVELISMSSLFDRFRFVYRVISLRSSGKLIPEVLRLAQQIFYEKNTAGEVDFSKLKSNYSGVGVGLLFIPNAVSIVDPKIIKQICVTKHGSFPKSNTYEQLKLLLGRGLVTSQGEVWKKQRALINPLFVPSNLANMNDIMVHYAKFMIEEIMTKQKQNNGVVQFENEIKRVTLRIVVASVFGSNTDFVDKMAILWVKAAQALSKHFLRLTVLGPTVASLLNGEVVSIMNELKQMANQLIDEKAAKIQKEEAMGLDPLSLEENRKQLITLLLLARDENGKPMERDLVLDECLTFLFAGFDTTSSLLTYFTWVMCRYPHIQSKVHEEIEEIEKQYKVEELISNAAELNRFEYLTCVLKETLRYHPPVFGVSKQVTENVEIEPGYIIPKGTIVSVNFSALHRNPFYWKHPNEFIPERFMEENLKKDFVDYHNLFRYCFVPFSLGARNCVGKDFAMQEAIILAAMLMKHYKVEYAHDNVEQGMKIDFSVVTHPVNLFVKFTPK